MATDKGSKDVGIDNLSITGNGIPTNVEFVNSEELISIFPNPNNGTFQLKINSNDWANNSVTVVDLLSREVYRADITKEIEEISLSEIADGVYYVIVNSNGKLSIASKTIKK